jgi:FixJ family two-component response regulator
MLKHIPAAYYPTTVLAVDDSLTFLENLKLMLSDSFSLEPYSSSHEIVLHLNHLLKEPNLINQTIHNIEDDVLEHRKFDINISNIKNIAKNPRRFEQNSVLLLDFSMPGINGKQVANILKNLPIQKILLTGETDSEIPIDLFNTGLIHQYLNKQDPQLEKKLKHAIQQLQMRYFQNITSDIIEGIVEKNQQESPTGSSCLNNSTFIEFFLNHLQVNNIVEFYLINASGSYLMLNANAEPSWLIVKAEDDMQVLDDLALEKPSNLNAELKQMIADRKLLFYNANNDNNIDWSTSLYPAEKIVCGKSNYYYSYITKDKLKSRNSPTISFSYREYLAEI